MRTHPWAVRRAADAARRRGRAERCAERVTVQTLEVVRVDAEKNLLLVKGAVPGATGGDVIVRLAVKAKA